MKPLYKIHDDSREDLIKWINALESGEYNQTRGVLSRNESQCCLGVYLLINGISNDEIICFIGDQLVEEFSIWEHKEVPLLKVIPCDERIIKCDGDAPKEIYPDYLLFDGEEIERSPNRGEGFIRPFELNDDFEMDFPSIAKELRKML